MFELSIRRTNVQPEGGVSVAVSGRKAIAATITSHAAVPAGLLIVSVVPDEPADAAATKATAFAGFSARMWVLPGSELLLAVAVFDPLAPADACAAYVPSVEWPIVSGTARLATSKASVIPLGGVHVAAEGIEKWATSIVFATVVVMLGVA
jgi:hypothetical protein